MNFLADLSSSKIVIVIINGKISGRILVGAAGVFRISANVVAGESVIIENFMSKMPSVVEGSQEVISKSQTGRRAVTNSVHLAGRNMGDHISVVNDSPMFRNVVHNSVSEGNVTSSGRSESVKVDLALVDNTVAGKIESSDGSKSTAQTVAGDVEAVSSVRFHQSSDLVEQGVSDLAVVAS